jgi:4,5-dihydroxyphthalate decarboxylase
MFADYRRAEEDYFRETCLFPIMHVIGIRRTLLDRHPWLAVSLYKAFVQAKALCMAQLGQIGHLYTSLPWAVAEFERVKTMLGEDYWSYGIDANRITLRTFLRYHHEQGLSDRLLTVHDIFAPAIFELSKI